MLDSIIGLLAAGMALVAAVFGGMWAHSKRQALNDELAQQKERSALIDQMGRRLDAARQANKKPIDTKSRTYFE